MKLLPAKFREYDKNSAAEVAQYFVMWERVTALCKILLSLNFTKTQFTDFTTKNNNQIEININYNNKFIPTIIYTKFLGLTVDCSLTLINHIDSLTKKLSTTCYLIQNIKPYLSISTLKNIYYSLSSLNYVLWPNVVRKLITELRNF
jgi:hypothetical protein